MSLSYSAESSSAFEAKAKQARFTDPIPVVVGGGTTVVPGFIERLEKELRDSRFPVPISRVFHAEDPLHAVARGALINAIASLEDEEEMEIQTTPAPAPVLPVEEKTEIPEQKSETPVIPNKNPVPVKPMVKPPPGPHGPT